MVQTEAHLPATSRAAAARRRAAEPREPHPVPGSRSARAGAALPLHRRRAALADPRRDAAHAARDDHDRRGVPARHHRRASAPAAHRADRADRAVRLHERVGVTAGGRVRVRGRVRDPRRRLSLRRVGDGADGADGGRGRDDRRARLAEVDGAAARRSRPRAARGRRHVRGDLDPRVQPEGEGTRRELPATERTSLPRARAARVRHHHGRRRRRVAFVREPRVRRHPRLPAGRSRGHGGALAHEARRRVALPPARRGDPRGREHRARRADAAPPRRHVALVRVDLHQPLRRSRDRRLGREPARHHRAPAVRRRAAAGAGGLPPRVRRGGHRHDARRSGRSHHPFERRNGADAALPGPRLPGRRPTGRDHAPRRRARGRRGPAGHRRRRQRRLPHRDPARRAPTARRCGSR